MKAFVATQYGLPEVLQVKEVPTPTPADNEVLIKVHAVAVNAGDWYLLRGKPLIARLDSGLFKPKNPTLGADVAGHVESVGSAVTQFKVGDEVLGDLSGCGWGGYAEYVTAPESLIALKPRSITFEQAAAVPMAAVTALQALRCKGDIQPGEKVLINGASGGVGTFAVQLSKAFGAEVTAVCSTRHIETMRSIHADHIIDYTREDFTRSGKQYDMILGANGYHPLSAYQRALTPTGRYVCSGGTMRQIFSAILLGPIISARSKQIITSMGTAKPNQADLIQISELMQAGKIVPVIERCYEFADVPDALRHVGTSHAGGKVVVSLGVA